MHQIIVGHMLGDGHIAKVRKGNSYFVIHRKAEHHEYNLWTKKILLGQWHRHFKLREDVVFLRDLINRRYKIKFNIHHQHNRPQHNILACPKKKKQRLLTILQSPGVLISHMSYKLNLI